MKKMIITMLTMAAMAAFNTKPANAQSVTDVIEELMLDYQKLAGMKSTLSQMYKGYAVLTHGYNAVKGVSMDNFNLHKTFLDAQLMVSPAVRTYPRTGDIIRNQQTLVSEYHTASHSYSSEALLSPKERQFLTDVYDKLTQASSDNLDELDRVITDSELRMTDAERLAAINRLYQESEDQLSYLRKFNGQIAKTIKHRQAAQQSRRAVSNLY